MALAAPSPQRERLRSRGLLSAESRCHEPPTARTAWLSHRGLHNPGEDKRRRVLWTRQGAAHTWHAPVPVPLVAVAWGGGADLTPLAALPCAMSAR